MVGPHLRRLLGAGLRHHRCGAYLVEFDPERAPVVRAPVHHPERTVLAENVFLAGLGVRGGFFFSWALSRSRTAVALTIASQSPFMSPNLTRKWRYSGRARVSMLGRAAGMVLSALSCLMRRKTVSWTHSGRVLTSKMGSHDLVLMVSCTYNMLGEDDGRKRWRL